MHTNAGVIIYISMNVYRTILLWGQNLLDFSVTKTSVNKRLLLCLQYLTQKGGFYWSPHPRRGPLRCKGTTFSRIMQIFWNIIRKIGLFFGIRFRKLTQKTKKNSTFAAAFDKKKIGRSPWGPRKF